MKVLWVKANKLLPVQSGGDIRSHNIARQLARKHELTFLSYYDGATDRQYEEAMGQEFPGAVCLASGKQRSGLLQRGLDYAARSAGSEPYAVARFRSGQVRAQLERYYSGRSFDAVVCDFLDAAVNFPSQLTIPSVLFQHNVESEIWRRHAETQSNAMKRVLYGREFSKMLRYEEKVVREFHHVIAVSENDKKLMEKWVKGSHVTVVPTGVDLKKYRPRQGKAEALDPLIVFVGAMDWEPNIDGVDYFCEEIWPRVKEQVPEARFRIVGRNPDRRVQRRASQAVEVTGSVSSVVEHLHQAAVVVVPLRIGGGTRLKIYEAMAAGKAVVSTSVGAEGLEVSDGRDIVLADDAAGFARAAVSLLTDSALRRNYELAAAATASKFDWESIGDKFSGVLQAFTDRFEMAGVQ